MIAATDQAMLAALSDVAKGVTAAPRIDWFEMATGKSAYTYRLAATITMKDTAGNDVIAWKLEKALPIKFKAADLNAKGTEVGIEELHLVHEGLSLVRPRTTAAR